MSPQKALVTKLYFAEILRTEGEDFEREYRKKKTKALYSEPRTRLENGQRHIISHAQALPKRDSASQPGNKQNSHSKSDVKVDLLRLASVTS